MKFIALALAALIPTIAFGNGGGYVSGTANSGALGAFQPKNAQQIEMQTEDLKIDLHLEYGHVDVEYTLHNPGKAVTAEIGFPCKAVTELQPTEENPKKAPKEREVTPPLLDFFVELDGQKLEWKSVREKLGQKDFPAPDLRGEASPFRHVPYWYTFKLPFEAGQTRKLHVRYNTGYFVMEGSVSDDSESMPETLTYLFSTAAVWKGAIREGKVTVRAVNVPADLVKFNLPKRFTRDGNQWTWNFTDFEPGLADDLNIAVHPKMISYGRPIPGTEPKEGEEPSYADFVNVANKWTLHHRDYTAVATSKHAPSKKGDEELTYDAANLADFNRDTAWVEGVEGDGVGESITLTLRTPRKLNAIGVANGYCKSDDEELYFKNGRPAEFAVSINGAAPFTAALPDERLARHEHLIPVPEGTGEVKTIKLTIQKVYPGTKYKDTCVSDITLITPLEKAPKISPAR